MKIDGQIPLHIGDYTILLLVPQFEMSFGGKDQDIVHLSFPTQILYRRPKNGWQWHKSFVFRIFGFGLGVAHQHCENPNWSAKKKDCKI